MKNNKIAEIPYYRKVIFDLLPTLSMLDDLDRNGNQIELSDSEEESDGVPSNEDVEDSEEDDEEEDDE